MLIVDFWAPWCQPCKTQDVFLENLMDKYPDKFVLAKVNADDNRFLSKELKVMQIPSLLFYYQGKEVHRLSGIQSQEIIDKSIQKFFNPEQ